MDVPKVQEVVSQDLAAPWKGNDWSWKGDNGKSISPHPSSPIVEWWNKIFECHASWCILVHLVKGTGMHGIIHSIESYERSLQFVVKLRERSIIHPKLHCCTLSVVGTVHLGAVCAAPDQKVVLEAPCWPPRCESFDFCCPFATLKFVRKKKNALINQLRSIKHSLSCIFVDIIDEFTIQIIFFSALCLPFLRFKDHAFGPQLHHRFSLQGVGFRRAGVPWSSPDSHWFPIWKSLKIHMIQYDSYQLETSKAKDATGIESVEQ